MIKIYQIAYKNLLRKKTRSLLTIVGIALSAWVLASLLGFNKGYESALNRDIDNMGFQVLVTAKGCPYEAATLMLKGGTGLRYMDENILKDIGKHKEIRRVTPMLMQAVFDPDKGESGGMNAYLGVDAATFPAMKSFLEFKQGGWFKDNSAREVVMGFEAAELEQREVGDLLLIPEKNAELKVVGVLKRTGTQDDGTIFLPLNTLQNVFGMSKKLTGVGIQVDKETDMAKFEEKLYDLPDVQVVSLSQVKSTIMSLVTTAKMMVISIAVIAILIAMIGVINTILMSVFERFQEIGILKSMGAMPGDIFKMIWIETVILCGAGGLIGNLIALALAEATDFMVRNVLPYAPEGKLVEIDAPLFIFNTLLIIGIGIVSGIYPALKAAKVRPIETIRGEAK
jgi:putative ABC transport system permease protein